MKHSTFMHNGPLVLLHGGAGPMDPTRAGNARATSRLIAIAEAGIALLSSGADALGVASACCERMESDPDFNAGAGSALQADGLARLSAALMDGRTRSFSGVVNVSYLSHPSRLCRELQTRRTRVLTAPGAELLARELGLPIRANLTEARVKRWVAALAREGFEPSELQSDTAPPGAGADTVGCLVRDAMGALVAAASTGGRGFEFPGRVSDTCSVAGTYASSHAAIAATGVGEQIIDDALASRLETRVRDGMSLGAASLRCFEEARQSQRAYGWVGLTRDEFCAAHTTASMPFAAVGLHDGNSQVVSSSLGS
jgi:L-asparaginase